MKNTTTFPGFTANQTFYLPTDISWVITRVQSFNDSDVPTAYSINTGFLLGPYNGSYTPGNGECPLLPSAKVSLVPPPNNHCLSQPCAGAASLVPFNQTNKALRISQAFNGSAYTPYVGPVQYVAAVAQQPANWFSAVAAFVAADPPGEVIGQQHSVPSFCSHVWSPDWCVLQSMTVVRYDRCISLPCSTA